MSGRTILLACLLLLPPQIRPSAAAETSIQDHLAAAKSLREKKDLRGALDRTGDAILLAHRKGDLLGEGDACGFLDDLAKEFPEGKAAPAAGAGRDVLDRREAMALLMSRLNARRSGALVSANALARKLALLATEHGDDFHLDEAEKLLFEWEKGGTAKDLSDFYTTWLVAISSMNMLGPIGRGNTDGFVHIRGQIQKGVFNGWADEVTHSVTELAAFYVRFAGGKETLDPWTGSTP